MPFSYGALRVLDGAAGDRAKAGTVREGIVLVLDNGSESPIWICHLSAPVSLRIFCLILFQNAFLERKPECRPIQNSIFERENQAYPTGKGGEI